MKKSALGTRIHSLRKEKGITQEELGKAIGVTSQAVSKWECGGTPDAEILPQIAEFFGVTIDNLYGRSDDRRRDLAQEITWELYNTKSEEQFEKAYQYCWGITRGLSHLEPDMIAATTKDNLNIPDTTKTSAILLYEEGVSVMRLNENRHNFYLMATPTDGIGSYLLEPEAYEKFFAILGKPDRMKTLLFLYKRKAVAVSAERLAKHLDMKKEHVVEIMQDFLELELVQTFATETDEGEETYYRVLEFWAHNVPLVPFLTATTDLIERPISIFGNTSNTKETLL